MTELEAMADQGTLWAMVGFPQPPQKIVKVRGALRKSGHWGGGGAEAQTTGDSLEARTLGGALRKRGLFGGTLETQTQQSAFEGLALEGAVEERTLELGSNSYPYIPPARHISVCRRAFGGRRACVGHQRQTCVVHGWQTCVGRVCIRIFIFHRNINNRENKAQIPLIIHPNEKTQIIHFWCAAKDNWASQISEVALRKELEQWKFQFPPSGK